MKTKYKLICFKKINSTNIYAKKLAEKGSKEGTVITAREQTEGKGRLGRTFVSKRGGLYFSVILRPFNKTEKTIFITVAAAVAAARAIERVSQKKCEIKWVNDIYINNKKVCGILTEGGFNQKGNIKYAILGVGINLFEPKEKFPENLPLADSVFHKKDGILFKNRIEKQLLNKFLDEFFTFYENLDKKEFINEYKQKSFLKGKKVTYTKDNQTYTATVKDIDDEARLVVSVDGNEQVLSHGEIQIIGMEQLPV